MKAQDEPNPALGWRALRVGLDKPGVLRMQLQALLRGANGRPLTIMFPFVAQYEEYKTARREVDTTIAREEKLGHLLPASIEIGAMLETPSLAFAPDAFFEEVEFLSIGGNDLKQFFFAADRENERVRRRYDTLNVRFLTFIEHIVSRCEASNTRLSFCGEDAGRPVEAVCFAAMGLHTLSMRPASIGPVKHLLHRVNLVTLRDVIEQARKGGKQSVREDVMAYLKSVCCLSNQATDTVPSRVCQRRAQNPFRIRRRWHFDMLQLSEPKPTIVRSIPNQKHTRMPCFARSFQTVLHEKCA